jgi:nicotinamidase-related amidase
MPQRDPTLHGNVPERSGTALLLIDVIGDFEFEGGEQLIKPTKSMAPRLANFKERARAAGIPAIYVNDNYGRWNSDFRRLVDHCINDDVRGREIARILKPAEDDYFVLKPKHSGFFGTTLELLLKYLGARNLILTGLTTDICVLFTAMDAYIRDYSLFVPSDCAAALSRKYHKQALDYMQRVVNADIRESSRLRLSAMSNDHGK